MERISESQQPRVPAEQAEPRNSTAGPISAEAILLDLQSVLSAAIGRLHEMIGCEQVAAWALREGGEPYVAAASFVGNPPVEPEREAFDALVGLGGPVDLREPDQPAEIRGLAQRLACSAAAPVVANDGTPLAVLLVGDGDGATQPVRPRVLAALDNARRRLEAPLAGALALRRLRVIDDEVRRLDRLAALGSLASEIAHEIRNPLVSIKTFLQLLPERSSDPEFFTSFLETASAELRRMERLLDVIVDQARPSGGDGTGTAVDVGAIFQSVTQLVRHRAIKRGISLRWDTAPGLPTIAIEDDALRQVVLNLTLNAIDATPDGGDVHLGASADGGGVAIVVDDTGPGVPGNLRKKIFEPFFSTQTNRSGGLGLAITRRVVEAAGGSISVDASEAGGAAFRVVLPVEAGARRP